MEFVYFPAETSMKQNQMYYMNNIQYFSPRTNESDSAMELEYTNSNFVAENTFSVYKTKKPQPASLPNHSKDSLKFGRRISKSFLQFIKQDTDIVLRAFLDCASKLLLSQAMVLRVELIDDKKLMKDSLLVIEDVWNFFAKNLSCSYNEKISKIPKDIWDMVFTEEGFWKAANKIGRTLQLKDYFSGCGDVEIEIIKGYFKKIIFLMNRGLILSHMYLKKARRDDFFDNISKFENYIVLGIVPELFDAYNHRRGVFIDECCRACKVCSSKLMEKSVVYKIKAAWEYAIAFEKQFKSNSDFQSFQEPVNALNVLQFLIMVDDAIASFSR